MDLKPVTFDPIGIFSCEEQHRYELPRQGILADNNLGCIELKKHLNFEQALEDLEGFSHIWLLYHIHLNDTWKPKVRPPRTDGRNKISVFATRSPYRPCPVGMSCVELVKIEGLKVWVRNFDLLDETPILDIKPYLAYSDAIPEATCGWLPEKEKKNYKIDLSKLCSVKMKWIYERSGLDLRRFSFVQLSSEPTDKARKRVKCLNKDTWQLACRTWRIDFEIDWEKDIITLLDVYSGYSNEELNNQEDPHHDKRFHHEFSGIFNA
ncbi:MAG: tRNA (N6-threonylcarbamoyladenosine(37)-N6)-methyltransferase TrmO [Lentisphaeria bacterium]|nr:tRNA (N6-threonylcarbamoyladenosine(37)-N6)-methyltransferase TrmO [Lentisphaeria bacterium]